MYMEDSYKARKALESSIGLIKAAYRELVKSSLSDDEKFEIAHSLHFDLKNLEEFRIPGEKE